MSREKRSECGVFSLLTNALSRKLLGFGLPLPLLLRNRQRPPLQEPPQSSRVRQRYLPGDHFKNEKLIVLTFFLSFAGIALATKIFKVSFFFAAVMRQGK